MSASVWGLQVKPKVAREPIVVPKLSGFKHVGVCLFLGVKSDLVRISQVISKGREKGSVQCSSSAAF